MTAEDLISGKPCLPPKVIGNLPNYGDKRVYVTGACGSIGSELRHSLYQQHAHWIGGCDWNELKVSEVPALQNVDLADFEEVAIHQGIDIFFHCAAYKHVTLGESNRLSFLHNNYGKIQDFMIGKETRFVLISSDKAAGHSTMGESKRAAEHLVVRKGGWAIRLVNCAFSEGSVLWRWESQLVKRRGPLNHKRYFMTMRDAAWAISFIPFEPPGLYTVYGLPEFTMEELSGAWERSRGKVTWMDYIPHNVEEAQERLFDPETEKLVDTKHTWLKRIEYLRS